MNLIMPGFGNVQWFRDCAFVARKRSGCETFIVSDKNDCVNDAIICTKEDVSKALSNVVVSTRPEHYRWFINLYIIEKYGLNGPSFMPDWDEMFFWDISKHFDSFGDYDVLRTQEPGHCFSAAYYVKDVDILREYLRFVDARLRCGLDPGSVVDMHEWSAFIIMNGLKAGNLCSEVNGGVFDHNIHVGVETYLHEEGDKKIIWDNGFPYFVRREDGRNVKALSIHCWGTYKYRTSELLRKSGLKP